MRARRHVAVDDGRELRRWRLDRERRRYGHVAGRLRRRPRHWHGVAPADADGLPVDEHFGEMGARRWRWQLAWPRAARWRRCRCRHVRGHREAVNFIVRHASPLQKSAEAFVFFEDFPGGCLHLGRCLDAELLAHPPFGFEFLKVFLSPGTRPPLVVSDSGKIRLLQVNIVSLVILVFCKAGEFTEVLDSFAGIVTIVLL